MAEDGGDFELPGMRAHWVGHPTDIDDKGCDGLYLEGYIIIDFRLWLKYCDYTCRPFIMFSVN